MRLVRPARKGARGDGRLYDLQLLEGQLELR